MRTDELADSIRARIHRGELGPSDQLTPERELAAELGVSRQVVREALSGLSTEGYLEARRGVHGGWFVTELAVPFAAWITRSLADLNGIVDVRLALECQAVRFAASRRTEAGLERMIAAVKELDNAEEDPKRYRHADLAFHGAVALAAKSPRLWSAIESARGELFEPAEELWADHRHLESKAFHEEILAAIGSQDPELAVSAMTRHIETTRGELIALRRRRNTA